MNYRLDTDNKHLVTRKLILFPGLFILLSSSYAQNSAVSDSLRKVRYKISAVTIENLTSVLTGHKSFSSSLLIPPSDRENERILNFYDSLKVRASKTLVTRKLYDFMVTPNHESSMKSITGSSETTYMPYTGKIIRKIEIRRLNVFGSSIQNPDSQNPNKIENLLNKTHVNTNESIVRKNLLFSEGDTVSPLTLSDNERLLRQLPFIDDARIILVPVSDYLTDVVVLTKDVYSLGGKVSFSDLDKWDLSVFEKNIFGMGHEFGIELPYDTKFSSSPGIGISYRVNNILKSFINLDAYFYDGSGKKTYGFDITRRLISTTSKYAGGISVREMFTSDDLDSLVIPALVKYNLQDYWLLRSFLINQGSAARFIIGARYTNNNVFDHPFILPDSYHYLQQYKIFLGSLSFSTRKYYKANLIYGYGRTEDIPRGGLLNLTLGKEINEFKKRTYFGSSISAGESVKSLGYLYGSAGISAFFNQGRTEQGMLLMRAKYISNLSYLGRYRIRNFVTADYTRGFERYTDEHLVFNLENGFSGFGNDSVGGAQRLSVSLESVLFSPVNFYGFRFAVFGFADMGFLFGASQYIGNGDLLSAVGLGIRIRNDNLVLNTLQIRIGFYPNLPRYSTSNHFIISGEQLLKPPDFEPVPPAVLPFK
ncbi:MAG: hypothetical protein Q8868_01445 [Bacteroidota bacterium]|nr:hypothetical protein [Bacteroidota bacterium]